MMESRQTLNLRSFLSITLLGVCIALAWPMEIQVDGKFVSTPVVIGGSSTVRNKWPFLAALYQVRQNQSQYFCGGTVISTKHILTAAHCIQGKYSSNKISPDDIFVRLGAFNLSATNEHGAVQMNVNDIYVHPEWDIYNDRYDADIAILILRENVIFTNHIQPVCLPTDDVIVDGSTIDDVEGLIVGWGLSDNKSSGKIPREAIVKAINDSHCYREDAGAAAISSPRTFCVGKGDEVPNVGDSGFFVLQNYSWVQNGISSVLRTDGTGHVTLDSLSIYTNVQMFKDWILETVAVENRIHFNCFYKHTDKTGYGCWLSDVNIRGKYFEVASSSGNHQHGRTNDNVEALTFKTGSLFYLPYKIGDLFVNLKKLKIHSFMNTKLIGRSNLKNLENLMIISISRNDIEFLERDCLWDLPQLTDFKITGNRLKALHEKLFEKNLNLRYVDLSANNLESLPRYLFIKNVKLVTVNFEKNRFQMIPTNLFLGNPLLEGIYFGSNALKTIDENIFVSNINLKFLSMHSNQLEMLPTNLFQKNTLLETIYLCNNPLVVIATNFSGLPNIKHIHLGNIYFTALFTSADRSSNLTEFLAVIRPTCS